MTTNEIKLLIMETFGYLEGSCAARPFLRNAVVDVRDFAMKQADQLLVHLQNKKFNIEIKSGENNENVS